jgi:multidrug efflux pump subunit AcrA (membrane-fusion protein)
MVNLIKHHKFIVGSIIILLVISGTYYFFFSQKELPYNFEEARRGNIVKEVSVIGQIKKGEQLNLGFRESGEIDEIYVRSGEIVEEGERLIKLDANQLRIQLQESQASLNLAQAELNKLLTGATEEKIRSAEITVENTRIAYYHAEEKLENVKKTAEDNTETAYENSFNILEVAFLKISNAYTDIDSIQRSYFYSNDQESTRVKQQKLIIQERKEAAELKLDSARETFNNDAKDNALLLFSDYLNDIYSALNEIRNVCDSIKYRNVVSDSDKTIVDNHRSYINTEISNVISSRQTISSTKLSNSSSINISQAEVSATKGSYEAAKNELKLLITAPRQEDIEFYEARIDQARAKVLLFEDRIEKSILRAPINGQIGDIKKEIGEQVAIAEPVIYFIPDKPFQIEASVPEADIGKINLGDKCEISLDAFPRVIFEGKLLEIDLIGTVMSGVVYYKTKISIETEDNNIRPGMTADVVIISDSRDDVLIIPWRAVKENGREFVRVVINGELEERDIETGLRGSEGYVEVLAGLQEGEKVVTFIKD